MTEYSHNTFPGNWYENLSSPAFTWIRWILFSNQIIWLLVLFSNLNNISLTTASYCLAILPSLLFVALESLVLCWSDNREDLHKKDWVAYRYLSVAITIVLLIIWLSGVHNIELLIIAWLVLAVILFVEIVVVSNAESYWCNCCYFHPYQQV